MRVRLGKRRREGRARRQRLRSPREDDPRGARVTTKKPRAVILDPRGGVFTHPSSPLPPMRPAPILVES